MKWKKITSTSDNEVYHLYGNDKKLLTLTLHPFSQSARLECDKEKRVFQIRKEGFLRNKTILRNEYGIKIGEIGQDNHVQFIELNDERFFYEIGNNPAAALTLYKDSIEQPFAVCGINTDAPVKSNNEFSILSKNKIAANVHAGLLMALCWYMYLPVAKDKMAALVG